MLVETNIRRFIMGDYASKGVAGSGLGLGIAGTALGVLNSSNNGNGLLGGLFGNGNGNVVSQLQAENAMLRAEQKCCCEKQELREQILVGKINEVALSTKGRFDALDQTISCLANSVQNNANAIANITSTIVPLSKICPEPMARYNSFVVPTNPAPAPAA